MAATGVVGLEREAVGRRHGDGERQATFGDVVVVLGRIPAKARAALSATAWPGSSETLVIENSQLPLGRPNPVGRDCEHNLPLASTAR